MTRNSELLDLYKSMLRIRRVEEALSEKHEEKIVQSPLYLYIGQEAVASGVSYWLKSSDMVFSHHRSHGHYLAKGGNLIRLIGELFHSPEGCCHGRAGSMFLADTLVGFMGATPISGGTVPLALGAAFTAALKNNHRVCVVYFGDGAFEEGVMHEAMNFAKLKNLPIVFVCENNSYSGYTHIQERQPEREISAIAEAHGIAAFVGDGNDVMNVSTIAQFAIKQARERISPQFLEFKTHRWREHCGPFFDDDLGYRQGGELEYWLERCPVNNALQQLINNGTLNEKANGKIEQSIQQEIKSAFDRVLQSICQMNPGNLSGAAN
jgi:TPP-dependent pyruvate/acetoin dehydrogenase alpha subunit